MSRLGSLSAYPANTLQAVRAAVAALMRYEDMLPTDLSIKLDILHSDISDALRPARSSGPVFMPHPASRLGPFPGHSTPTRAQALPRPSHPERHQQ